MSVVGRTIRLGSKVAVLVVAHDPRCQMIALDPDTPAPDPEVLRNVARAHDRMAGVYGAVVAEGMISGRATQLKYSTEVLLHAHTETAAEESEHVAGTTVGEGVADVVRCPLVDPHLDILHLMAEWLVIRGRADRLGAGNDH